MSVAEINALNWREPLMLWIIFIPLILWLVSRLLQVKQYTYADPHLIPWAMVANHKTIWQRIVSKWTLYIIAWMLFAIVASGPRLPIEQGYQKNTADMNIMLVVDVSRSMQATDVFPSRLQRAKIEIEELLERAINKRIGIIVFAAKPHVLVPLTSDYDALRFYLNSLDSVTLPTHGSVVLSALELAGKEVRSKQETAAIVLFSDGDFDLESYKNELQADIPVYVLGLGSEAGEAIQLEDGKWLQHDQQAVITTLNQSTLRSIANNSGGANNRGSHYSPAVDNDSDWQRLYDEGIYRQLKPSANDEESDSMQWQELYHWPLLIAIILLWLALLPYRFRAASLSSMRRFLVIPSTKITKSLTIITFTIVLNFIPQDVSLAANGGFNGRGSGDELSVGAEISHTQAFNYYRAESYTAAKNTYKQLSGYEARYGEASSHYKLKDYKAAIRQFSRAVIAAKRDTDRAVALYNLGNSYFNVADYESAMIVFKDALRYRPEHKNSLHNLNFSTELKAAVDARIAAASGTDRLGNGPQSVTQDALNVNGDNSISVDQSDNRKLTKEFIPELGVGYKNHIERLIQKGLLRFKLAAENNQLRKATKTEHFQPGKLDFINARLRMQKLDQEQVSLWKRLFEMEEGFPAPLDQPRNIEGVKPW